MGRPREHDERTAAALLGAAERIIGEEGLPALSVRGLADAVGTSTRAVYSLFGSKDGLVIALGSQAFNMLKAAMDALPVTDDPTQDLIEAGVAVFRGFTLAHPALFGIGFLQKGVPPSIAYEFWDAQVAALARLHDRLRRLRDGGRLGTRSVPDAALEFDALCEGLAALELRGAIPAAEGDRRWREALHALAAGWGATAVGANLGVQWTAKGAG